MNEFNFKNAIGITALEAKMDDFTYKKHSHQEYSIGVTLKGIQGYHLKGERKQSYQNGVMFFNPEENHDGMSNGVQGLEYIMLYIKPEQLLEATNQKHMVQFKEPIVYNNKIAQNILQLAKSIFNGSDDVICYEHFQNLVDGLKRDTYYDEFNVDNVKLKLAKDIIKNNVSTSFKLDFICSELNLSKYQFIRFFKQQTGITPYQYYINYKAEVAKHIIEKSKDIYLAIAECAFVDLAHLNKVFKYRYGVTAYQYMSKLK